MKLFHCIPLLLALLATAPAEEASILPLSVEITAEGLAREILSYRGSAPAGTGVSLNGLTVRVPWSTVHHAELPLPTNWFVEPTLKTGLDNWTSHPIAAIALQSAEQSDHLRTSALLGTQEHYTANLSAAHAGAAVFAAWEKARRIDHAANGLDQQTGSIAFQHFVNDWQIDLLAGHAHREYGVQGYRGAPPAQYAEAQTADTLLLFSAIKGELDYAFLRTGIALREFEDRLLVPAIATDQTVRSRYATIALEGRTLEVQHLALNLRADLEHERADGDLRANDHRTRAAIHLSPEARFDRFTLRAGLATVLLSNEATELLPEAGIGLRLGDNSTLFATGSAGVRQPDYETLDALPNQPLQKVRNSEICFHQFASASLDWRAAVFHRRIENATDQIGGTSVDLGHLEVSGIDASIHYRPSDRLVLQMYYQWLHKENAPLGGLYETDFPEHLLAFAGTWHSSDRWSVALRQQLRLQTDNPARSGPNFGADATLGLHYRPRSAKNVRLSFLVENLFGSNFQPFPGLKPRPTSFSTSLHIAW